MPKKIQLIIHPYVEDNYDEESLIKLGNRLSELIMDFDQNDNVMVTLERVTFNIIEED